MPAVVQYAVGEEWVGTLLPRDADVPLSGVWSVLFQYAIDLSPLFGLDGEVVNGCNLLPCFTVKDLNGEIVCAPIRPYTEGQISEDDITQVDNCEIAAGFRVLLQPIDGYWWRGREEILPICNLWIKDAIAAGLSQC